MSEGEEDYDELPAISVNSTMSEVVSFTMPTADELASQRARELEIERELQLLRARHEHDERPAAPAALAHCDSSSSEGEAALAAAVSALRVQPRAAAAAQPPAARLLAALCAAAPEPAARALRDHAAPLAAPDERLVAAHLARVVAGVGTLLAGGGDEPWPDEDALCAGALLAVALAAREPRGRRPAARAMHGLLDDACAPHQAAALARLLQAAVPAADWRVRLALSDQLRGGGGGGAQRLADALLHGALAELLGAAGEEGEASEAREAGAALSEARLARLAEGAWRRLGAAARAALLQLLGRALAAAPAPDRAARRRLLAALAPPARHRGAAHHRDELEVLVGVSKLRLLFRSDD